MWKREESFEAGSVYAGPASVDHPRPERDCEHARRDRFSPPSTEHDSEWMGVAPTASPSSEWYAKLEPTYSWEGEQIDKHENSRPVQQWQDQLKYMALYILKKPRFGIDDPMDALRLAESMVMEDWKEQGIWNPNWSRENYDRWMHEELSDVMSESKASPGAVSKPDTVAVPDDAKLEVIQPEVDTSSEDTEQSVEPSTKYYISHVLYECVLFPPIQSHKGFGLKNAKLEPIQADDSTSPPSTERPTKKKRNYDASRPFYQFMHQVSKERERFQIDHPGEATLESTAPNVNAIAYENVKQIWVKRGLWNKNWGILPGMKWNHEEPFELGPFPRPRRRKFPGTLRQASRRRADAIERWLTESNPDPETPEGRDFKRARSEA